MPPWPPVGLLLAALLLLTAGLASAAAAPADEEAQPPASCPDPRLSRTVPENCPCSPINGTSWGGCERGFVCAQNWPDQVAAAAAVARATLRRSLLSSKSGDNSGGADASGGSSLFPWDREGASGDSSDGSGVPLFVCQECAYGQFCPRSSALPPVLDPSIQLAIDALACPAGFYCPTPASQLPCPPGFFCPPSTVTPITCNMSLLVEKAPLMPINFKPATVAQRVFLYGDALQGNSCPANATHPSKGCPEGFYCPDPATIHPCPAGYFCPLGSLRPQPCPFLTHCPEGASSADLSYSGFVILAILLLLLWICFAVLRAGIRHNQRRLSRQQEACDRLWRVLHPLFGPAAARGGGQPAFRALRVVRPRLALEFRDLGLELHDGRTILSGVTGRFEHSRVSAILGPSGAGKTTMLSVLRSKTGGMGRQQGRLLVNGREMRLSALQSITGFVPQEDVVHEDLTVRENLAYSARLRLSAAKPAAEKAALVEDCIDLLQLRHIQHQVVGSVERRGISGGQRKRTNIGIELVAKPSLLLMDEPTSGLDSTAAADILGALTRVARLGCTIVAVVHQPRFSIFRMFDDVLLLGKGGRMVYSGPSRLTLPYFESLGFALPPNENPADFALDIVSGSVGCQDGSPFQPAELPSLWLSHGRTWVQLHTKLAAKDELSQATSQQQLQQQAVDPEQLQMLEQQFDEQDTDGDGALDADGLLRLLEQLGLEPSRGSVAALMAELAVPRTGLLPKHAFIQYIQSGGRAAGAGDAAASGADDVAASKRRNETLYRVYSIEHYTLASALSELSASALSAGMRAGGASLRELAAAHHEQQQRVQQAAGGGRTGAGSDSNGSQEDGSGSGSAAAGEDEPQQQVNSPSSPIKQLSLGILQQQQQPSQETIGHAETSPAAASSSSSDAPGAASKAPSGRVSFLLPPPPAAHRQAEQAMLVEVPPPLPEPKGLLARLGLDCGTPLRATPGAAAQFWLLLLRSGIKWTRNWPSKMLEILLLTLAAVVCGVMHGTGTDEWGVRGNTAVCFLTLGILSGATSLSLFGSGARVVWWREQERGVKSLSYFLAATCTQAIDVALHPAIFLSIYASMTLPALPWAQLYGVGVLVCWFCASLGALMSVLAPPSSALMATVALLMITGGMINGVSPNYRTMAPALRGLTTISYNRWAIEIVTIQSFAHFPEWRWPATKTAMNSAGYCGLDVVDQFPGDPAALAEVDSRRLLDIRQYCENSVPNAVIVLFVLGTILRLLTGLAVAYCPRGLRLEPLTAAVAHWLAGRRTRRSPAEAAQAASA